MGNGKGCFGLGYQNVIPSFIVPYQSGNTNTASCSDCSCTQLDEITCLAVAHEYMPLRTNNATWSLRVSDIITSAPGTMVKLSTEHNWIASANV